MIKINTNINGKKKDRKIKYNPNGEDFKMNNKVNKHEQSIFFMNVIYSISHQNIFKSSNEHRSKKYKSKSRAK